MRKKKVKPSDASSLSFHELGFRFLGEAPARFFPLSNRVREGLLKSNVKINHIVYISSMFFWVVVAFALPFPVAFFIFEYFFPLLRITLPILLSIIYSLLISLVSGGVTLLTFLYYPLYVACSSKTKLEKNLVYVANYMSILASAGATPWETFTSLIRVGEVFGLKESAKSIMKRVELLGEDLISALDEESKITPSRDYAQFLQGYIATVQTGGNLQTYLMTMSQSFMETRRRLLRKMISQLGLAGELFVAALVALPIIMITMLSVMGFFGGEVLGGLSAPQVMALMVYVMIPFTAVAVLIVIDTFMSSW